MNRVTVPALAVAACLLLASCIENPGEDTARAACSAYGDTSSSGNPQVRTTALGRAQRAAEANDSFAALPRDMSDAWSRADAMAAVHNAGRTVSGSALDAYLAADKRVRADCAAAGVDLGPLEP